LQAVSDKTALCLQTHRTIYQRKTFLSLVHRNIRLISIGDCSACCPMHRARITRKNSLLIEWRRKRNEGSY